MLKGLIRVVPYLSDDNNTYARVELVGGTKGQGKIHLTENNVHWSDDVRRKEAIEHIKDHSRLQIINLNKFQCPTCSGVLLNHYLNRQFCTNCQKFTDEGN